MEGLGGDDREDCRAAKVDLAGFLAGLMRSFIEGNWRNAQYGICELVSRRA
jgi:hypothetical protein